MAAKKKKSGSEPTFVPVKELSYEEAMAELESINEQIESGDVALEMALSLRKRGQELIAYCTSILDAAAQEIDKANMDDDAS